MCEIWILLCYRKDHKDLTQAPLGYLFPDSIPFHKQTKKAPYYEEKWYQSSMEDYINLVSSNLHNRVSFDFAKYLR